MPAEAGLPLPPPSASVSPSLRRRPTSTANTPYGGAGEGPFLGRTCPAGSYRANAWGLFDLHGNVWEWCKDWSANDYYGNSPAQDPLGPSNGSARVIRGGSWQDYGQGCRAAFRYGSAPSVGYSILGFRVAAVPRE